MSNSVGAVYVDRPVRLAAAPKMAASTAPRAAAAAAAARSSMRRKAQSRKQTKKQLSTTRKPIEIFLAGESTKALRADLAGRIAFLNRLYGLSSGTQPELLNDAALFEHISDLLLSLMQDDHQSVRAMCLRILRFFLHTERHLIYLLKTHADIYLIRSLDVMAENEEERCEAFRLVCHMLAIYKSSNLKKLVQFSQKHSHKSRFSFPKSIMQPVVAIALQAITYVPPSEKERKQREQQTARVKETRGGGEEKRDPLSLPCVSLLMEFAVYEPELALEMAGTDWMVKVLTGEAVTVSRRVSIQVARLLIFWLDSSTMRQRGQLHLVLERIFALLVDFGIFSDSEPDSDEDRAAKESMLQAFAYKFLALLRSWAGLLACAAVSDKNKLIANSPLRMLDYLGMGTVVSPSLLCVRSLVVDTCCEFVGLPYAYKRFETWQEALRFYATQHEPDEFKCSLREDFILARGHSVSGLFCGTQRSTNLLESFRALALFILVNANLPQSLTRLIVASPDDACSIKATLLLYDLVGEASSVLPSEWRPSAQSLPTLMHSACEAALLSGATAATHAYPPPPAQKRYTHLNADNAATVLIRLDELRRVSLLQSTSGLSAGCSSGSRQTQIHPAAGNVSLAALFLPRTTPGSGAAVNGEFWTTPMAVRYVSDSLSQEIITDVLELETGDQPDWAAVDALLSRLLYDPASADSLRGISSFIEKLMLWFRPSSRNISRFWNGDRLPVVVGKKLVACALRLSNEDAEYFEEIQHFVEDIRNQLQPDRLAKGAFSLKHLSYHGTMYYFGLVSELASSRQGVTILERSGLLQVFHDLMTERTSAEYVKLIVSSLDYATPASLARTVLQKALRATNLIAREWCTRFLGLLASLEYADFATWGMRLLMGMIGDPSAKVVRQAVRLLHIWLPHYPAAASLLRAVPLSSLGDAGIMLQVHLYSCESATNADLAGAQKTLELWMNSFNARYVAALEDELREALLGLKRTMAGKYARSSSERHPSTEGVIVPVHLLGALAGHDTGRALLHEARVVRRLADVIKTPSFCDHENASLHVKSAMFALANIGSAQGGMSLLSDECVADMVRVAEESEVLSVRGTAFAALNVLAGCQEGARALARFGWESNRHRRVVNDVRVAEKESERRRRSRLNEESGSNCAEGTRLSVAVSKRRLKRAVSAFGSSQCMDRRSHSDSTDSGRPRVFSDVTCTTGGGDDARQKREQMLRRGESDPCLREEGRSSREPASPDANESRGDSRLDSTSLRLDLDSPVRPHSPISRRQTIAASISALSDDIDLSMQECGRDASIHDAVRLGLKATRQQIHVEKGRLFASEWAREPHSSTARRRRWRLRPIEAQKALRVARNAGPTVTYFFMTRNELESLAEYRRVLESDSWLWSELSVSTQSDAAAATQASIANKKSRNAPSGDELQLPSSTSEYGAGEPEEAWSNVALPAEIYTICRDVFKVGGSSCRQLLPPGATPSHQLPSGPATPAGRHSRAHSVAETAQGFTNDDDRGMRSGHGRVRVEGAKAHTTFCFYCTAEPGSVQPFDVPAPAQWSRLRLQVLELVDLLEIKRALPQKKLLALRKREPLLFDWPCLYADVLELLDEYRFSSQSRCFLQELFYGAFHLIHTVH